MAISTTRANPSNALRPVVLAIGGHDPCGGAGIQADIEAIHANGGQPVTLLTALTAQNTERFDRCLPVATAELQHQAQLLLDDIAVDAIKLGLVPNAAIAQTIEVLLTRHAVPVVLDPVLAAGAGAPIADADALAALRALLPHIEVVTPNSDEARRLSGKDELDAAAAELLRLGCRHVLLTGTHEDTPAVINTLYRQTRRLRWSWPRLPHVYHGSGCTLAASLATWLARGLDASGAAAMAQEYCWRTLRDGERLGRGQYHPRRLP